MIGHGKKLHMVKRALPKTYALDFDPDRIGE